MVTGGGGVIVRRRRRAEPVSRGFSPLSTPGKQRAEANSYLSYRAQFDLPFYLNGVRPSESECNTHFLWLHFSGSRATPPRRGRTIAGAGAGGEAHVIDGRCFRIRKTIMAVVVPRKRQWTRRDIITGRVR